MAAAAGLTRLRRGAWLDAPRRLAGVDLARGLAVLGMLAAHLLVLPTWRGDSPSTWISIVDGRPSILFALLAGVSLALMTGGTVPPVGRELAAARVRLGIRAVLLWAIGIVLVLTGVPVFVILPAYGILFLLALPLLGLRFGPLALGAAVLGLGMPWLQAVLDALPVWSTPAGAELARSIGWTYPFPTWLAFVVAGMAVGRLDLRRPSVAVALVAVGGGLAVTGYGLAAVSGSAAEGRETTYLERVWTAVPHSSGILEVVGSGGFALGVLGACLLLCRTPVRWVLLPLRATGAMPLTAYTAQLVAWVVAGLVLVGSVRRGDAFRALEPLWPLTLGLVAACTLWALLLGRGPLERLVDRIARAGGALVAR